MATIFKPVLLAAMAVSLLAAGGCLNVEVPRIPDINISGNSVNAPVYEAPPGELTGPPVAPPPIPVGAPVILYAPDLLAYPGTAVQLSAVALTQGDPRWAAGAVVTFFLGDRAIGSAPLNADGEAGLIWQTPRPGDYPLSARITQAARPDQEPLLRTPPATALACIRPREAPLLVVDVDCLGEQAPAVLARAAATYTVVYSAKRSALAGGASKDWLRGQGYRPGPVLVAGVKELAPGGGAFKTARPKDLVAAYPNARAVVWKPDDAEDYLKSRAAVLLMPRYKADPKSMRKMAKEIDKLSTRGPLQVVTQWSQVDQALSGRVVFPARAFSAGLYDQAFRMDGKRD